jgi:hypothetical protein
MLKSINMANDNHQIVCLRWNSNDMTEIGISKEVIVVKKKQYVDGKNT